MLTLLEARCSKKWDARALRCSVNLGSGLGNVGLPKPYGKTTYRIAIPPRLWKERWQWNSHMPASSGTMSAVTICIGAINVTSVRIWLMTTVFPCQCGV